MTSGFLMATGLKHRLPIIPTPLFAFANLCEAFVHAAERRHPNRFWDHSSNIGVNS